MGRIKTKLVKRTAKELIKSNKDRFTKDFNLNKQVISELVEMNSKKLRNVITGYVTRLIRREQEQQK